MGAALASGPVATEETEGELGRIWGILGLRTERCARTGVGGCGSGDLVEGRVAGVPFGGASDLSGVYGDGSAAAEFLSAVYHQTTVRVDELGTVAAAATAVVATRGLGPPSFHVDRPFLFAIRHAATRSILFMGRIADPPPVVDPPQCEVGSLVLRVTSYEAPSFTDRTTRIRIGLDGVNKAASELPVHFYALQTTESAQPAGWVDWGNAALLRVGEGRYESVFDLAQDPGTNDPDPTESMMLRLVFPTIDLAFEVQMEKGLPIGESIAPVDGPP